MGLSIAGVESAGQALENQNPKGITIEHNAS